MTFAPRITQPMSVPWVGARRGDPVRILVTLERRVSLVVEDDEEPVVDPNARVFQMELIAMLTIEERDGAVLEQRRVRAQATDLARFAGTVFEQIELACQLCPGITVAVTRDERGIWHPVRAMLSTLRVDGAAVDVAEVVERPPLTREDLELTRRSRKKPAYAAGTAPPPLHK
ncbi:MAG: hypothetical protein F9K40_23440 [Kofleriaceae bacterium]|nr:MAG: hypothetical protein F9K40_23440 [Kofleriaceae bacterium]MBZ0234956.1 hypothetical protein [Kofleriaceae bacterium]